MSISKPHINPEEFNKYLQSRSYKILSPSDARKYLAIPNYQRDVIKSHITKLKTSLAQGIPLQDITVVPVKEPLKSLTGHQAKYEIVDGQHRALALIELNFNLPICIQPSKEGTEVFLNFNKGKPISQNHIIYLDQSDTVNSWVLKINNDPKHSMYNRVYFGKGKIQPHQFQATTLARILSRYCVKDTKLFYEFTNFIGKLAQDKNSPFFSSVILYSIFQFYHSSQRFHKHRRLNFNSDKHLKVIQKYNFTTIGLNKIKKERGYAYHYFIRSLTKHWNENLSYA